MIPADVLLGFLLTSVLLCIAPGPDNLFVLTQSALYGRKSGWLVTLGLCTGLLVHTTAVALGLAVLIQTSPGAFLLLKMTGAGYLLYLAWQTIRASPLLMGETGGSTLTNASLYRRGIVMNITNPKVSVFFLAFLPQFASLDRGPLAPQIFLLGGLFIVATLVVFGAIATAAGALGNWLGGSAGAQRFLNRLTALVLLALAVRLALTEI